MTRVPVSVIVMTKNEERNIEKCLRALADFDEVFVVDSHSTDRTVEIATSLGARRPIPMEPQVSQEEAVVPGQPALSRMTWCSTWTPTKS